MRVVPRRGRRRTSAPAGDAEDRPPAADAAPEAPSGGDDATGPGEASSTGGTGSDPNEASAGGDTATRPLDASPSGGGARTDEAPSGGDDVAHSPKVSSGAARPGEAPSGGGTATRPLDAPPGRDGATRPIEASSGGGRPLDRRAAERARRAAALRRTQEQRRARAGRTRRTRAGRRPRSALLALIITLGLLIAAVAVTGTLIATSREKEPVPLAAPLHVYPVIQVVSGACPAGTQGITGQTVSGPACYQLSNGIAIRKVTELRVQDGRAAGTHDVAISLAGADRRAFATLTRQTVGRTVAFVVRDQLVTAPRVDMPITDGKVVVTGRFSKADADRLVRTLKGS